MNGKIHFVDTWVNTELIYIFIRILLPVMINIERVLGIFNFYPHMEFDDKNIFNN